ncbi:methionyl-tRNA formyltransferase [bacterium]|nr:methionyl-tRNA formyltransferase [bacterium]
MNILYFGCDNFGTPTLEKLHISHNLIGVVTAPDKKSGRGMKLCSNHAKQWAAKKGVTIYQPENLDTQFVEFIKTLDIDLILLISYGKKLPREIIEIPKISSINAHPSLLPKYRGAAPIEWALINGEEKTGVTIITMTPKIDRGGVLAQKEVVIEDEDDIFSMKDKLSYFSAEMVLKVIKKISISGLTPLPQSGKPSYARRLTKKDGLIDWQLPSYKINNLIRGIKEWPGAFTFMQVKDCKRYVKIFSAENIGQQSSQGKPGEIISIENNFIEVACGVGSIRIKELQVEGKKRNKAYEFVCGYRVSPGFIFSK